MDTFTGAKMQSLTGHLVDHFALRRETLSVLKEVYRFQEGDLRDSKPMSPALRAELRVCQGLLPLVVAPLGLDRCATVLCSDASPEGFGVHKTTAGPTEFWSAVRYRERWRFRDPGPKLEPHEAMPVPQPMPKDPYPEMPHV